MNLATNLERSAFFFPERPAISKGDLELNYAQLNEMSNLVATGLLNLGVKPGDFIGIFVPNSLEWIIIYFGILKAGGVAVTLSSQLKHDELSLLLGHSKPRILFTTDEKLDDLIELKKSLGIEIIISNHGDIALKDLYEKGSKNFRAVKRDRRDTAAILYTGGTTGIPKGVMLSHESINVSAHNVAFSERSSSLDRALCFLPFNHVFGQMHIMNATILSGGCLELIPSFDLDQVLWHTSSGKITKLFGVPTVYTRLLTVENLKEKLGNVRYCFSAAATMAREIVLQWKEKTGLTIYEGYGMTETASAVTYNHIYRHVIGSVGQTVPGVEVEIRDLNGNEVEIGKEGEICIKGHNVMTGYLNNPEETRLAFWDDGWLRSGDIGVLDEDGYLYIIDRIKDMIITGGENVYPREVEEVIYKRHDVELCAVIGLPDKEWGERVTAFIVPKVDMKINSEELKLFLKSRLSSFKVPKDFIFVKDLPKSQTGKILKRELKKQFAEGKIERLY